MDVWDYNELAGLVGQRVVHANIEPSINSWQDIYADVIALGIYEHNLDHVVIYGTIEGNKSIIKVVRASLFMNIPYTVIGKFLDEPERINTTYTHVKTNKEYVLLYEGVFHMGPNIDREVAIYQEPNPKSGSVIWVRKLSIFNDGRFKRAL